MTLQDKYPEGREVVCVKTYEYASRIFFRGEVALVHHGLGGLLVLVFDRQDREEGHIISWDPCDNWELVP